MIKKIIFSSILVATLLNANDDFIKFGFTGVNDQIDIFNIKSSEISSIDSDELGDMNGFNIELNYSFLDDYSIDFKYDQKSIDYLSDSLVNNHLNLQLKKEILSNKNFSSKIIIGYESNFADDLTIYDVDTINYLIGKFYKEDYPEAEIVLWPDGNYYIGLNGDLSLLENSPPYGKFEDANDQTFFVGGTFQPKINNSNFNLELFTFFKQSKIKKSYLTSLIDETNQDILDKLENDNIPVRFDISRTDKILSLGFNTKYDFNDSFALKTKYEYIKIFRDDYLEETNDNHVVDVELNYNINPKFTAYIGGTIMTNQFNGVIPYFYDEYTKTTFDHKYGWAELGIKYKF